MDYSCENHNFYNRILEIVFTVSLKAEWYVNNSEFHGISLNFWISLIKTTKKEIGDMKILIKNCLFPHFSSNYISKNTKDTKILENT